MTFCSLTIFLTGIVCYAWGLMDRIRARSAIAKCRRCAMTFDDAHRKCVQAKANYDQAAAGLRDAQAKLQPRDLRLNIELQLDKAIVVKCESPEERWRINVLKHSLAGLLASTLALRGLAEEKSIAEAALEVLTAAIDRVRGNRPANYEFTAADIRRLWESLVVWSAEELEIPLLELKHVK